MNIVQDQNPSLSDQNNIKFSKISFFMIVTLSLFIGCWIGIGIGFILSLIGVKSSRSNLTSNELHINPTITPLPSQIQELNNQNLISDISPSAVPSSNVPKIGNCNVFPKDNPWNLDISKLPVNQLSDSYISSIGKNKSLHPDFGGSSSGNSWGIPFMIVTNKELQRQINFTAYGQESDKEPYPIPFNAPIEGGTDSTGDRHVLVVNIDNCKLYELYRAFPTQDGWNADSGAVFDLNSNKLRPAGWTSADAAGLPIFPGLVKYDEVAKGSVNHAIRFTTRQTQRAYIYPARHFASSNTDPNLPPMGLRIRLKANYIINGLPPQAKVIATAMKKIWTYLSGQWG
jgi:hypothetical protein